MTVQKIADDRNYTQIDTPGKDLYGPTKFGIPVHLRKSNTLISSALLVSQLSNGGMHVSHCDLSVMTASRPL